MPTSSVRMTSSSKAQERSNSENDLDAVDASLDDALRHLHAIVPPLWPLADYVAVNPCVGLTDRPFLSAYQMFRNVRDCDLLMSKEYFQSMLSQGRLSDQQIATAYSQCIAEHPEWYKRFDLSELMDWLQGSGTILAEQELRFRTAAEAVDQQLGSTWSSHITNDVTRHCAGYYDEGQAAWANPWRENGLFAAWREASRISYRMDFLGLKGFRAFVAALPSDPQLALRELLQSLKVPTSHYRQYLLCTIFSIAGWASYVRYHVRESENAGQSNDDLVGLAAIRLAYDVALARSAELSSSLMLWPKDVDLENELAVPQSPSADVLARYVLQVAVERSYRLNLLQQLSKTPVSQRSLERKKLQIVFCIDVRSEVMRRNLESVNESIETFGFAGFFGMPLEYVPLGFERGTPQCPVLLQPSFSVHEELRGIEPECAAAAVQKRLTDRLGRKFWKSFQSSTTSCFSYVESLGWPFLSKLMTDSFHWSKPAARADSDGLTAELKSRLGPDIHCSQNRGLDAQVSLNLAENMLRNLGLTTGFARIVALCGHASDVTNNPYRAALDCGACGGHSGESNARVAAALLNDPEVRRGLAERGIKIPDDTWFLAAVHQTTTDVIALFDLQLVPPSHADDIANISIWLEEAGRLNRMERSHLLGSTDPTDVIRRSQDWAEVRPEWGLAGNAAFIVARRSRTEGLNLEGRSFLHSYDHAMDPELKVLELIMTAPMVVTNWINMQYYASAVDPKSFGSGNKVIHNVVGQFGVLQGNGGDLMTGLPWQSVHDGKQLQHEPLRLLVVIDAPRASIQRLIEKHKLVRNLVTNAWVSLVAWEGNEFFRWTAQEDWEPHVHTN